MRSQTEQRKPRRQTEPMTIWVKPAIKREYERMAQQKGLRLSRTAAAALEGWLAQESYMQYDALIQATINQAVAKGMRAYASRLAALLVRDLFVSEQGRAIAYNILKKQPGMTEEKLGKIMAGSKAIAKRNIAHTDPELTPALQAIDAWLEQGLRESHD